MIKLPDYVKAYKEAIREEWEYLKSNGRVTDEGLRAQVDGHLKDAKGTTWGDLFYIERMILRLQTPEAVRRRAWFLRDKYRVVVGEQAYNEYLKSTPPFPAVAAAAAAAAATDGAGEAAAAAAASEKAVEPLREDLDRLLSDFHWRYQTTPMREGERNRISSWITIGMFIGVAAVLLAMLYDRATGGETGLSTILMVLLMGAMGASMSLQHRIQSVPSGGDAILNILSLRKGWVSVFLAPLSGAVFAFVLFLAFSSGLLQGTLFPTYIEKPESPKTNSSPAAEIAMLRVEAKKAEVDANAARAVADKAPADTAAETRAKDLAKQSDCAKLTLKDAESMGLSFLDFLKMSIPKGVGDLAKLLLWCFIAGFAERLLPDTLDRLIVRKIAVMEPEPPSNRSSAQILPPPAQPGGDRKAPESSETGHH